MRLFAIRVIGKRVIWLTGNLIDVEMRKIFLNISVRCVYRSEVLMVGAILFNIDHQGMTMRKRVFC